MEEICEILNEKLNVSTFNYMLAISNPEKYAHKLIGDIIESIVKKRKNTNTHNYEDVIKNSSKEEDICCSNDSPLTVYKYDNEGSGKYDYNTYENKEYYSSATKATTSTLPEYDERGFIKNTAKHRNGTKYDDEGFDKYGYDKDGYDKNGFDKCGYAKKTL